MREIHSVGFFEDRREIVVSHDSTEVRMRLRPLAGAEKLNQRNGQKPDYLSLTELSNGRVFEHVDDLLRSPTDPSQTLANDLGIV